MTPAPTSSRIRNRSRRRNETGPPPQRERVAGRLRKHQRLRTALRRSDAAARRRDRRARRWRPRPLEAGCDTGQPRRWTTRSRCPRRRNRTTASDFPRRNRSAASGVPRHCRSGRRPGHRSVTRWAARARLRVAAPTCTRVRARRALRAAAVLRPGRHGYDGRSGPGWPGTTRAAPHPWIRTVAPSPVIGAASVMSGVGLGLDLGVPGARVTPHRNTHLAGSARVGGGAPTGRGVRLGQPTGEFVRGEAAPVLGQPGPCAPSSSRR